MSHLLAPTHTLADSIPLGRRINEIMMEKGAAYTISAMAKRLEINRETLRLMLKGEREIYTFELEKIAEDLKVPVERILQSDVVEDRLQLETMINTGSDDFERIKHLAEKLSKNAVGYTERCFAKNALGCAYFLRREHTKAIEILNKALPEARLIYEKFCDSTTYLWLMVNLMNSYSMYKDYKSMKELILCCDSIEVRDDRTLGVITHNWAMVLEELENDIERAREKHYESLHHYLKTEEPQKMGIAYLFVAQFEYRQVNYEKALEYFMLAWEHILTDKSYKHLVYAGRDYAKLLIRQHRNDQAAEILNVSIEVTRFHEDQITEAQFLLLFSVAKQETSDAEEILNREIGTVSIQKLACQFIIEHAYRCMDFEKQALFEEKRRQLSRSPIDALLLHSDGTYPAHYLLTLFDHCIVHRWNLNDF